MLLSREHIIEWNHIFNLWRETINYYSSIAFFQWLYTWNLRHLYLKGLPGKINNGNNSTTTTPFSYVITIIMSHRKTHPEAHYVGFSNQTRSDERKKKGGGFGAPRNSDISWIVYHSVPILRFGFFWLLKMKVHHNLPLKLTCYCFNNQMYVLHEYLIFLIYHKNQ